MSAVQITRQIDSEHLDLPELKPFIGKRVSITIEETVSPSKGDRWQALQSIAGRDAVDPEVYRQQRAFEVHQQTGANE